MLNKCQLLFLYFSICKRFKLSITARGEKYKEKNFGTIFKIKA